MVWEYLVNNYDFNALLGRVSYYYYRILMNKVNVFNLKYNEIELGALREFIRIYHINGIVDRKKFAVESIKSKYKSILFKL